MKNIDTASALKNIGLQFFADDAAQDDTATSQDVQNIPSTAAEQEPEKTFTQKEINKAHFAGKSEAEREILSLLGVKSKDELARVKEAYANTLTREDQLSGDLQALQRQVDTHKTQADESAYVVMAMEAITGKPKDEVETIVKMAKGLVTDELPMPEAIKTVIGMIAAKQSETQQTKPSGFDLMQPDQREFTNNPFMPGKNFNLTKQGELYAKNPEMAKSLAAQAGRKL